VSCLAYIVDVIVEGQRVVCRHTKTLYCCMTGTGTMATVTSFICGFNLCLALVQITVASDLSGFRQRLLSSNQWWTDSKQTLITLNLVT